MRNAIILFSVFVVSALRDYTDEDFEKILLNVPENQRLDFIRYHLRRGSEIKLSNTTHPKRNAYSDKFSVDFFDYLIGDVPLTPNSSRDDDCCPCYPQGCIDFCDSGIHPSKEKWFTDCDCD